MFRKNRPEQRWEYSYKHVLEIIFQAVSNAVKLNGKMPLEFVTGETVDISKYLNFDFYDIVGLKKMPVLERINLTGGLKLHMYIDP